MAMRSRVGRASPSREARARPAYAGSSGEPATGAARLDLPAGLLIDPAVPYGSRRTARAALREVRMPTALSRARNLVAVSAALAALSVGSSDAADSDRCAAQKLKCAARFYAALVKCEAAGRNAGRPTDPLCIARARSKFDGGSTPGNGCFAKIEAKYPACPTTGNQSAARAALEAQVAALIALIDPPSPTPTPLETPVPTVTPNADTTLCCAFTSLGFCSSLPADAASSCTTYGGTVAPTGTLCSAATGTCTSPDDASPGNCCASGVSCLGGPAMSQENCWSYHPSAVHHSDRHCDPDGACTP